MPDKNTPILKKSLFYLCVIAGFFIAIEVLLQIGVRAKLIPYYHPLDNAYYSYNIVPYFSKPCCISDSISGFRWLDNSSRAFKICRGEVVFDQIVKPNNAGFISPHGFEPHKKDSTVFRWLVFGDSFTDGYYLAKNWPAAATDILKNKNTSVELHSFALNGCGISTWARVFDWLNSMNYEYDGIIIACFGNDLSRDDFIMDHSGDYCYFGWRGLNRERSNVGLQKEKVIFDPESSENIKEILSGRYAAADRRLLLPYYFHILYTELRKNYLLRSQSKTILDKYILAGQGQKIIDSLSMDIKYGHDKMTLINDMLAYCKQNKKSVLIASVPDMTGIKSGKTGDAIQLNAELKWLAAKYNGGFFDGYDALKSENAGQLFLKYDGHWNRRGSDLFAGHITELIISESKK